MSSEHSSPMAGTSTLSNGIQVHPRQGISTINSSSSLSSLNSSLSSLNSSLVNNGPLSSSANLNTSHASSRPLSSQPEQIIVPVGNVLSASKSESSSSLRLPSSSHSQSTSPSAGSESRTVLDKVRLRELVKEVDPLEQMDDDVEEVLLQMADDFIENVVTASCQLAKHRKSNTLEAKDVQLYLEHSWNIQVPGFGSEEIRPYKKSMTTEAHKQRLALIRKTLKKY